MYPHERSLVKEWAGRPFALVGVNSDSTIEEAQAAVRDNGLTWRSFYDGPGGPIAAQWEIEGWPTLVVLDHRGVVRHRHLGNPGDVLVRQLESLIQEAESAVE